MQWQQHTLPLVAKALKDKTGCLVNCGHGFTSQIVLPLLQVYFNMLKSVFYLMFVAFNLCLVYFTFMVPPLFHSGAVRGATMYYWGEGGESEIGSHGEI